MYVFIIVFCGIQMKITFSVVFVLHVGEQCNRLNVHFLSIYTYSNNDLYNM